MREDSRVSAPHRTIRSFCVALLALGMIHGGSAGAAPVDTLLPVLSSWAYYAGSAYPDPGWFDPTYDYAAWPSGNGILGYGETWVTTTVPYGPDPNNKYITTCFRAEFELASVPSDIGRLLLVANYDDGFVAYLNGTEIARRSLPGGPIDYSTLAGSHESGSYEAIDITEHSGLLEPNINHLAVEVHQRNGSSSDMIWDGSLIIDNSVVQSLWSGAVTSHSVRVVAKIVRDSAVVRLAVSTDILFTSPSYSSPDTAVFVDNNGAVSLEIAGLSEWQKYYYAVEADGVLDTTLIGTFTTFPADTASFTFAFSSCARTGSDHPVFETIRSKQPLFFLHTGDFHYENISVNDRDLFRQEYERALTTPGQARLYREYPIAYIWDDHDYGPNNSDSTAPGREAARLTYREYVPHYPLPAGDGADAIYFTFTVGRVKFIVTDCRSARSPASAPDDAAKTMLGETQKQWFKQELLDAEANNPLVVWVNSLPWIGITGDDGWHLYTNERREIADFLKGNDIHHLCMLSGDAHMIAIDDGTNSDYATGGGAGFPVMHAASLDQTPSVKGGPYSHGAYPNRGQFGLMTVSDLGDRILVHWRGRNYLDQEIVRYDFMVSEGIISAIICGDATSDSIVNVGDAVHIINYIFKGGPAPDPLYAADPNGDGEVNVGDAVYLLDFIFKGGPDPACPE